MWLRSQQVYLMGTMHVSKKSADDVGELIRMIRPDTVFVELCEQRAQKLLADAHVEPRGISWADVAKAAMRLVPRLSLPTPNETRRDTAFAHRLRNGVKTC